MNKKFFVSPLMPSVVVGHYCTAAHDKHGFDTVSVLVVGVAQMVRKGLVSAKNPNGEQVPLCQVILSKEWMPLSEKEPSLPEITVDEI